MNSETEARELARSETMEQLTKHLVDAAATLKEAKQAHLQALDRATDASNGEDKARARVQMLKAAVGIKLDSL